MLKTKGLLKKYAALMEYSARIIDICCMVLAAILTSYIQNKALWLRQDYFLLLMLAILLLWVIYPKFSLYQSWRGESIFKLFRRLFFAWLTIFVILVTVGFLTKLSTGYSRLWLGEFFTITMLLQIIHRIIVRLILNYLRRKGYNFRSIVIIGAGSLGQEIANKLKEQKWTGLKIAAFLDDDIEKQNTSIEFIPVVGPIEYLADYVKHHDLDEVWIALPLEAKGRVQEILFSLQDRSIEVRYIPDIFSFHLFNHSVTEVVGIPLITLSQSPMYGLNYLLKEIEDKTLALLILILVSPVMLIIALMIKLTSPGPIIFKQKRHGWDNKQIIVYKFRTMKVHKEQDNKVTQATKSDPRLTKIGAFLRRTSLDEIPQFINVLQGRMSIVGPRPHAIQHNEIFRKQINFYMLRHHVKPGITGWAQVCGWRGEVNSLEKIQKRVEYDFYYIKNWSLFFDLKIILLTFFKAFKDPNAY